MSSAGGEVLIGAGGIVTATIAGVVGRSVMQYYAKRQTDKRDTASIYERLYGKPANPRTNEPATVGWTTVVENRLTSQDTMLRDIKADVKKFGSQIIANVDHAAKAAATEVLEQVTERDRVNKRDEATDR